MHFVEGGAWSNVGGRHVEGVILGSNVDPEDIREFLCHHTHVEVRAEGSDRPIVILGDYNLLLNYD